MYASTWREMQALKQAFVTAGYATLGFAPRVPRILRDAERRWQSEVTERSVKDSAFRRHLKREMKGNA